MKGKIEKCRDLSNSGRKGLYFYFYFIYQPHLYYSGGQQKKEFPDLPQRQASKQENILKSYIQIKVLLLYINFSLEIKVKTSIYFFCLFGYFFE